MNKNGFNFVALVAAAGHTVVNGGRSVAFEEWVAG
jgi:hypothetical protein